MFKSLRLLTRSCIALGAIALASACGGSAPADDPGHGGSGGQGCTNIGCYDGFELTLKAEAWPAGSYRFVVKMDDKTVTCDGNLPLVSCDKGTSLKCDGEGVMIGESGCALPAEQHGFSSIHMDGSPAAVNVSIELDGKAQAIEDYTPTYQTVRPNGPNCEPECKQASDTLLFAPLNG